MKFRIKEVNDKFIVQLSSFWFCWTDDNDYWFDDILQAQNRADRIIREFEKDKIVPYIKYHKYPSKKVPRMSNC